MLPADVLRAIASKFGRQNSPRRAPTRGGGHPTRGVPYSSFCPATGRPQPALLPIVQRRIGDLPWDRAPTTICPYQLSSLGVMPCEGRPQGAPLPIVFSRRFALRRAPTRGAPTDCPLSAFCPGKGAHKGRPYQLSSLGVLPCEGRPQGAPLPIVLSRRFALRRAPTRGAPTDCLLSAFCPAKGAHKGRPYRLSSLGVLPCEGRPQGAPLPIVFSRRFALRRAPTRGAPTDCPLSAFCPAKGAHKGRPYRLSSLGVLPWEGRPQGAPLPDSGSLTSFFLI